MPVNCVRTWRHQRARCIQLSWRQNRQTWLELRHCCITSHTYCSSSGQVAYVNIICQACSVCFYEDWNVQRQAHFEARISCWSPCVGSWVWLHFDAIPPAKSISLDDRHLLLVSVHHHPLMLTTSHFVIHRDHWAAWNSAPEKASTRQYSINRRRGHSTSL